MVVRLLASCTRLPLLPGKFLVLIPVRCQIDLKAIVPLEGLGQLKNPVISSRVKPVIFQLVV
jgi:hypothetical protein